MKKKLNEVNPPVAPAVPGPAPGPGPGPARNIGQDYAAVKKILTKLGQAFDEYGSRMSRLNMALQQRIAPLTAATSGSQDRITQLQKDYEDLVQTSQDQMQKAERTISDLRQQLKDALSSGQGNSELLRIAKGEITGLEQTVANKTRAMQEMMDKLDKARGRLQAGGKTLDAYEAQIEQLKQANAELQQTAEEAVDKFNKLLGGVTRPTPEATDPKLQTIVDKYRNYGNFDILEHLAKAKKNDKKNAADW